MNSRRQLSRIVLKGFKSIRECDLELKDLNVLIGPNGAGKSNFISFFHMMRETLQGNLQLYVGKQGGPDSILYFGRKTTESLHAEVYFGNNAYKCTLEPTKDNRMMFSQEVLWWNAFGGKEENLGSGHFESNLNTQKKPTNIYDYIVPIMKNWHLYHFHDTGETSLIKQRHGINDNLYLRPDARNLAAFLYFLKKHHPDNYQCILETVNLVAPFFGDFLLRPHPDNKEQIELEWIEKGHDIPFKAHMLSDGTLRFICLATLLLQPEELMPETILIDEPELGLHPFAISMLASLLRSASATSQIIVSTQSVNLLNEFSAEDVIVADRADEHTQLKRLDSDTLRIWLEDYSLGELWEKNILGGRPTR
ncbi:MAG: AAA family ATPase [Candidatus Riflebacteria bacterium]|nr:AAA family ATPase [Candidatus Riflebacteria bacterium]